MTQQNINSAPSSAIPEATAAWTTLFGDATRTFGGASADTGGLGFYAGQKVPGFKDAVYLAPLPGGEGSFGSVHRVENRQDGVHYAMKIPKGFESDRARQRFRREAERLLALGSHRNLVRVVSFFEWEHRPCLFMEYIDGTGFENYFRAPAPDAALGRNGEAGSTQPRLTSQLRPQDCLRAFIEVCNGMAYAYERGILHLDLKPANILWDYRTGVPKIIDFGLAGCLFGADEANGEDGAGDAYTRVFQQATLVKGQRGVAGTLPYMAPEQFLGLAQCDTRSDIYAFGVVMYQMVSGERPFQPEPGVPPFEAYRRLHSTQEVAGVPSCDPGLEAIILRCLRKRPVERYGTFAGVMEALQARHEALTGRRHLMDEHGGDTASDLQGRAVAYLNLGRVAEAQRLLKSALGLDPSHPEARLALVEVLRQQNQKEQARKLLDTVLRDVPDSAWAWNLSGHLYFEYWDYPAARASYLRVRELDPQPYVWANLANTYLQLGQYEETRLTLEDAAQRFGSQDEWLRSAWLGYWLATGAMEQAAAFMAVHLARDWDGSAHRQWATALFQANHHAETAALLETYLRDHPLDEAELWNLYGLALSWLERKPEAVASLCKACELAEGNAVYANTLLKHLWDQPSEALAFAEAWLAAGHQPNVDFLTSKAWIYSKLGLPLDEARCYQEALALDPNAWAAAGSYVSSLCQAGQTDEAVAFAFSCLQPGYPPRQAVSCISTLTERGLANEALDLAQRWLELGNTPDALFWSCKSQAHAELEQHEAAAQCYADALAQEPGNANYATLRIGFLRKAGRLEDAVAFAQDWSQAAGFAAPNKIDFWGEASLAYAELGQYGAAAQCLRELLAISPEAPWFWLSRFGDLDRTGEALAFALNFAQDWLAAGNAPNYDFWKGTAEAHVKLGHYAAATQCYREALALKPGETWYVSNQINSLRRAGRAGEALAFTEHWLAEVRTPDASFWNRKGQAHFDLQQYAAAAESFREALALEPGDAIYADNRIYSLYLAGQAGKAVVFAGRWLDEGHIPNASFCNHKGLAHYHTGQYAAAAECFREALALEPGNATYAGNRVDALRQAGQAGEVVAFAEHWVAEGHDPGAGFWNNVGLAHLDLGQFSAAAECFRKALALEPGDAAYAGNRIYSLYLTDQADEALAFAERWLAEGHTPHANFWNFKGVAHIRAGQFSAAAECFRKALALEPGGATYAGNRVDALRLAGQAGEAIAFAEGWLAEGHTPCANFWNGKGVAHIRAGQFSAAAECFREALALEPGDAAYAGNRIYSLYLASQAGEAAAFAERWLAEGHTPSDYFQQWWDVVRRQTTQQP